MATLQLRQIKHSVFQLSISLTLISVSFVFPVNAQQQHHESQSESLANRQTLPPIPENLPN